MGRKRNKKYKCQVCNKYVSGENRYKHLYRRHRKDDSSTIEIIANQLGLQNDKRVQEILKVQMSFEMAEIIRFIIRRYIPEYLFVSTKLDLLKSLPFHDQSLIDEIKEKAQKITIENTLLLVTQESRVVIEKILESLIKPTLSSIDGIISRNVELISRKEYKLRYCSIHYLSWDKIKFKKDELRFGAESEFFIPMDGSSEVLNQLINSYFLRFYGNEIYKIVICNGIIDERLSTGYERIKSVFYRRIKLNELGIKKQRIKSLVSPEMSKYDILELLSSPWNDNEYLRYIAENIHDDTQVFATYEKNNVYLEEVVVFVMKNDDICSIIWENTHTQRATYIFKNVRYEANLVSSIIGYMECDVDYKRLGLTQNRSIIIRELEIEYVKISHTDILTYQNRIKRYITGSNLT